MLLAGVLLMSIAAATAPAPAPCSAGPSRQFDFWLGEWDVRGNDAAAQMQGRNTIRSVDGGCALLEEWVGAKGTKGHSLNVFDATDGKWHQFWVDSSGSVLRLSGGLVGDEMVMTGVSPSANGGTQQQRITWSPRPDGSVRQHWESSDDGRTWTTAFDGIYRHRAP